MRQLLRTQLHCLVLELKCHLSSFPPGETGSQIVFHSRFLQWTKSSEEQAAEDLDSGSDQAESDQPPTQEEIGNGLKDALSVGIETVVNQLGTADGFNLDSAVHIPLPGSLDKARSTLEKPGMSSTFEKLELGLNRAAEVAVPKSRELLLLAVQDMTIEDVMQIYRGPDDAATQYFRNRKVYKPISG
ncbi:MAG: hypothetical protein ACI9H8_002597 [Lysobacterales bacterium]|jgi:hypothetical protein